MKEIMQQEPETRLSDGALLERAIAARERAYAPYSSYQVGAALETEDGDIYTGCNIENASYGGTCCAERTAVYAAVSAGARRIRRIAVAGGSGERRNYAYPCGICRQVLREFSEPKELTVLVGVSAEDYKSYCLEELLPDSFGPEFRDG